MLPKHVAAKMRHQPDDPGLADCQPMSSYRLAALRILYGREW